jgi:hypothetical protein
MSKQDALSAERVRAVLDYDQETGEFTWKQTGSRALRRGDRAGSLHPRGYIHIKIGKYSYAAHRLAWLYVHKSWPSAELDHRNGCRSDNRIANLRPCDGPAENNQNTKRYSSNRSGYHGVGWHKSTGRWRARISVSGKHINLGLFDSPELAAEAYRKAKAERHCFQPEQRNA